MGKACITNVNGRGVLLAEYLKTQGRIAGWSHEDVNVCLEFNGELEITFEDYMAVHPRKGFVSTRGYEWLEREDFKKHVQTTLIKTLRGAEVIQFNPQESIVLRSTERTEIICVRLTKEEKERVEEKAKEIGVTLSDFIRSKVLE